MRFNYEDQEESERVKTKMTEQKLDIQEKLEATLTTKDNRETADVKDKEKFLNAQKSGKGTR